MLKRNRVVVAGAMLTSLLLLTGCTTGNEIDLTPNKPIPSPVETGGETVVEEDTIAVDEEEAPYGYFLIEDPQLVGSGDYFPYPEGSLPLDFHSVKLREEYKHKFAADVVNLWVQLREVTDQPDVNTLEVDALRSSESVLVVNGELTDIPAPVSAHPKSTYYAFYTTETGFQLAAFDISLGATYTCGTSLNYVKVPGSSHPECYGYGEMSGY